MPGDSFEIEGGVNYQLNTNGARKNGAQEKGAQEKRVTQLLEKGKKRAHFGGVNQNVNINQIYLRTI